MIKFVTPIIVLAVLFGCSGKTEQESDSTTSTATTATKEAEGVIIEPQTEPDTLKGSLKAYAKEKIGDATLTIQYYSPAVRGRMIWGGLVAYNNVWVTGAHRATSLEFDKSVKFDNTTIPPGRYALFTIPAEDEWTVIINKKWDQHLADNYDQADDLIRIKINPTFSETRQERLRYTFVETNSSEGVIVMQWDKLEIRVPFIIGM